jgi:DNA-binding MltR family transcriptional regulator
MKKITILLPIHKIDEDESIMLANALTSIENFYDDIILMIICPPEIEKRLESFNFGDKLEIKIIKNISDTSFISQINLGIDNVETEWFSILEIDDVYKKTWLSLMLEYINEYKDVDVFLPIIKDINEQGNFISFTNESAWAYGFTEKQGFINNEVLLEFQNYQTSGGLYRTNIIKENGKFKDNIKLTFSYEFLLRLTHNGVNIMIIPKIGYVHVNFRKNSLFWQYLNDKDHKLTEKETKFWIETAKKEFFFKNKRDITYVES